MAARVPKSGQIEVIDEATTAMFRAMTPAERLAVVTRAYRTARQLVAAGIRHYHSDWTEDDVNREVARRMSSGAN